MKKTVVITGANRGIGLAMSECFHQQGYDVYALCRQSSLELDSLAIHDDFTIVDKVDVITDAGISTMVDALQKIRIDILICNAGILRDEQLGNINLETIREQFEVNALAPLRVVDALHQNLANGGKVAMITSRMGSITDNGSGGRYGYRMSKAALNAASMSLSKDLAIDNISVGIYHPGYVQTGMVNFGGDINAEVAGKRIIGLINALTLKESGIFKHSNGEILPW